MSMDTSKAIELVEQLDDNTDDLEESLQPILSQALSETTKKLPLLDRAKLHVVIVYAIESLLFSYLKLNGVDAKEHPVFRELTRVKQYFAKIKDAEQGPGQVQAQAQARQNLSVDKQAAARIIQHALAANKGIDLAKAEAEARQRLLAKRKLKSLEDSMKEKAAARETSDMDVDISPSEQLVASLVEAAEIAERPTEPTTPVTSAAPTPALENELSSKAKKKEKKRKRAESNNDDLEEGEVQLTKSEKKKLKKKEKKEAKAAAAQVAIEIPG